MRHLLLLFLIACGSTQRFPSLPHQSQDKSFDASVYTMIKGDDGQVLWSFRSGSSHGYMITRYCPAGYHENGAAVIVYEPNSFGDWRPDRMIVGGRDTCTIGRLIFSDEP